MNLSHNEKMLIDLLVAGGYKAYVVGGFIRDAIMGKSGGDVDITTSAKPLEIEKMLTENGIKYVETGIKHGTITAVVAGVPYEITTFRTDGEYTDNRHPKNVEFVSSVSQDLARRDFTVNAIAYNDYDGFIDLYGGAEDIKNKIIRAVGEPNKRFQEDALRIMRALRFASVLGFEIEQGTRQAIFNNAYLLKNIAAERIFAELKKLLLGDNVERVLLEYKDVMAVIIPELLPCFDFEQNTKWHLYDVYTHIVKSVALAPKRDYMRLTLLLHDIGKPYCLRIDERGIDHFKGHPEKSAELAKRVLERFKASNDITKRVLTLISVHDDYITLDSADIKAWLRQLGEDMTLDYIDVKIADLKSHNLKYSQHEIDALYQIRKKTEGIIGSNEPYKISQLAVNGNDLIALGYSGKDIAVKLNELVNEVSKNPCLNSREQLLDIIKQADKK